MQKKRTTILDVAALAGVSKSAVSDILNRGETQAYPQSTQDRVIRAMQTLGYQPHRAAQSLRSGRTNNVGVMLTRGFANPFFARMFDLFRRELNTYGLSCELLQPPLKKSKLDVAALTDLHEIDAMIVGPLYCWDAELIGYLSDRTWGRVQVVTFGVPAAQIQKHPHIALADEQAGRLAGDYLLDLGHRRLGFMGASGPADADRSTGTMQWGLERAVEDRHGAAITMHWQCGDDGTYASAYREATQLVQAWSEHPIASRPTAWSAKNDQMGMALLRALLEKGYRVPEDVSVLGFDNVPESAFTWPGLSSVDSRMEPHVGSVVQRCLESLGRSHLNGLVESGETMTSHASNTDPRVVERASAAVPPA